MQNDTELKLGFFLDFCCKWHPKLQPKHNSFTLLIFGWHLYNLIGCQVLPAPTIWISPSPVSLEGVWTWQWKERSARDLFHTGSFLGKRWRQLVCLQARNLMEPRDVAYFKWKKAVYESNWNNFNACMELALHTDSLSSAAHGLAVKLVWLLAGIFHELIQVYQF